MGPAVRHLGTQTQRERGTVGYAYVAGEDNSTLLPLDSRMCPIAVAAAPVVRTGCLPRMSALALPPAAPKSWVAQRLQ